MMMAPCMSWIKKRPSATVSLECPGAWAKISESEVCPLACPSISGYSTKFLQRIHRTPTPTVNIKYLHSTIFWVCIYWNIFSYRYLWMYERPNLYLRSVTAFRGSFSGSTEACSRAGQGSVRGQGESGSSRNLQRLCCGRGQVSGHCSCMLSCCLDIS